MRIGRVRRLPGKVRFEWVPSGWSDLAIKGNRGKESMVAIEGEL